MITAKFFYEDGQGNVVDEYGVEPMDLVIDEEKYTLKTLSMHTQYLQNKPDEEIIQSPKVRVG